MANETFDADVRAVQAIDAVPRILEVVCKVTGMGFAAVARVTDCRWIACAVRDEIAFGLQPGGELNVKTTICDEIRASGQLVVIDRVDDDPVYRNHHTPRMYGIQSYISIPIVLGNGQFFGTLCAIDPKPHRVSDASTIHTFQLFAELIAFHLVARDHITDLEAKVENRTAELRTAYDRLAGQREEERTRIARELHDALGQMLTALKFGVDALPAMCEDQQVRGCVGAAANELKYAIDAALDEVDRIVSELRPMVLDSFGCVAAIEWQVAAFAKRTRIHATCDTDVDGLIPADLGTALFRIVQESLTNVARHAHATRVRVNVSVADGAIVLAIEDNGKGIHPTDRVRFDALGVRGMAERLRALKGSLSIEPVDTGGTRLVARVPAAERCRA